MGDDIYVFMREIGKQVYLAIEEASKKWIFRHREWPVIYSQLVTYFGDRLTERL